MPCVSQDNSLSAHTVHLVFLNISESELERSVLLFLRRYLLKFLLNSPLCDCYEFLSKTVVSELQCSTSVATVVKSQVQRASPVSRPQSRARPFACRAFCSTDYRKKRDCSQSYRGLETLQKYSPGGKFTFSVCSGRNLWQLLLELETFSKLSCRPCKRRLTNQKSVIVTSRKQGSLHATQRLKRHYEAIIFSLLQIVFYRSVDKIWWRTVRTKRG